MAWRIHVMQTERLVTLLYGSGSHPRAQLGQEGTFFLVFNEQFQTWNE